MPRVVDAFIFYNEVEMLEYRLEVLWDFVDHFVIVEAPITFTGKPKAMFFDPDRYAKYMSKIVHIVANDVPRIAPSAWDREIFQRNAISRGLATLNLARDDVVMISDVDEIPNPTVLSELSKGGLNQICSLKQIVYNYNLISRYSHSWYHPKVVPYGVFIDGKLTAEGVRRTNSKYIIENGGWHCSWFGTPQFIQNKILSFSHQEYNSRAYTDPSIIQKRVEASADLFNRSELELRRVPYDPSSPDVPPRSDWLLSLFTPPIQ